MSDLDDFDGYVNFNERGVLPKCPGIYLVTEDGRVVYVGQSVNVKRRFIHHHRRIEFAELNDPKVYWKACELKELQKTEQDFIKKFSPRLNIKRDGRQPRAKPFQARKGNRLIFGPKRKPELVKVLSVSENEIEMQAGNDIIVLRFPDDDEVVLASNPKGTM